MKTLTKYQESILNDLKQGAKIQCSEGSNYKTWLIYPDAKTKTIRRDSAEKICEDYADKLYFGDKNGIFYKNKQSIINTPLD